MKEKSQNIMTQECECGNTTYVIKYDVDRSQLFAECTDCGRPTTTVGDGMQRQMEWICEGGE